jgi:2-amino-4-hydroxy-6-hydroxymethyldihydropteridine diphosphokinase
LTVRAASVRAVVGLGANLGDRLATMRAAVRQIKQVAAVESTSRVYRTAPVGELAQPGFLNAAALVLYRGSPAALLDALRAIEITLGRVRAERWGPRVIDLDLLWIDGVAVDSTALVVPHPRLLERAFALVPLLEIVPIARDPRTGQRYIAPPGDVQVTDETL